MRRIQKNRARGGVVVQKVLDIGYLRAKFCFLFQWLQHSPSGTPLDIRQVGREVRTEDQTTVARAKERFAEKLFEDFGTWPNGDVFRGHRNGKLALQKVCSRLAKLRNAR